MNKLIKGLKGAQNQTFTENGAGAFKSTLNACLDAFGTLGAVREWSEDEIISCFKKAFYENQETALRLLFYVRDVRGGLGERKTFRVLLTWLANEYPDGYPCERYRPYNGVYQQYMFAYYRNLNSSI